MKNHPKALTRLNILLFVAMILQPVQMIFLYGTEGFELSELQYSHWAMALLLVPTLVAVHRASRLSLILVPTFISAAVVGEWTIAESNPSETPIAAILSLFLVMGAALSAHREVMDVVLNPGIRWWKTPKRWRIQFPVRVKLLDESRSEYALSSMDISSTGAFLGGAFLGSQNISGFYPGEHCQIAIRLSARHYLHCRAKVIRTTTLGVGLQFVDLAWVEKLFLRAMIYLNIKARTLGY